MGINRAHREHAEGEVKQRRLKHLRFWICWVRDFYSNDLDNRFSLLIQFILR